MMLVLGVGLACAAEPRSPAHLRSLAGKEVDKLAALYSDGFASEALSLRQMSVGPLFDSEQTAVVAFFVMQGVGLSHVHQEYVAVFATGSGRDLSAVMGPKERPLHLVASTLVGGRRTRTLDWKTARIRVGAIEVEGRRWVKGDPGCCPSAPIKVTFTIPSSLTTELMPAHYPVLSEVERPLRRQKQ